MISSLLHKQPAHHLSSYGLVLGLAAGLSLGSAPVQAAGFTGFSSTTGYTYSPNVGLLPGVTDKTKADVRLDSVTQGSKTFTNFSYVTEATVIKNTAIKKNKDSVGPGSSDHGDQTVADSFLTQGSIKEKSQAADIVASLGNNNLNSIIDTEDNVGTSIFDVYFSDPTDTFAFWERGRNSDLKVTAILSGMEGDLNPILGDSFTITQNLWGQTDLFINTAEIRKAQELGTYGLQFSSAIIGLRLESSMGFNGADFKVVGLNEVTKVPEPSTMLGSIAIAFGGFFKRKLAKSNKNDKA